MMSFELVQPTSIEALFNLVSGSATGTKVIRVILSSHDQIGSTGQLNWMSQLQLKHE